MARFVSRGWAAAGLFTGPVAWFLSQQANYAAVMWSCGHHAQLAFPITLGFFLIAASGAALSFSSIRRGAEGPHAFLALLGFGMAVLFCFLILLQGSAAFVLNGCER